MSPSYHMSLFHFHHVEKCLLPAAACGWMCFILGKIWGRRFTRVVGTQDAGALVLLKHALYMMDGAYYLNANKYQTTNWLHFSSFPCCLWLLNGAKSSLRHITVLISSNFFLCSFSLVGIRMCCLWTRLCYSLMALPPPRVRRTVWCKTAEVQSCCKSLLAQDSRAEFKRVGRFVFLTKVCRTFL